MSETIHYRFADKNDIAGIVELLNGNNLPVEDINSSRIDFLVALDTSDKIIGCIGIEQYSTNALLRSFAVDSGFQNKKIGTALLNRLIGVARQSGVESLHLLTTTAENYFSNKGFSVSQREAAPDSISSTKEFSSLCPSSSSYMVLHTLNDYACCYFNDAQIIQKDEHTGATYWSIQGKDLQFTSFQVPANTLFTKHQHAVEQITYVLDGQLFFELEKTIYQLSKGDSIVIPKETEHTVWTENTSAKAVDAWSPINKNYTTHNH